MTSSAIKACRETLAVNSKSFALAAKLLPRRTRDHAAVIYAWCRRADDAIDDITSKVLQQRAVTQLVDELARIYSGEVQPDPMLAAFQEVVWDCQIPHDYPHELVAGLHMDVIGHRYRELDQLYQYCYRVASTVGLMMCHVLGLRDTRAVRHAAHLGIAMQLTNICRDVMEDWNMGRLYIPEAVCANHGLPNLAKQLGEPFPEHALQPMRGAVSELLRAANDFYASADRGMRALDTRSSLAIRAARLIYSAIGDELSHMGHDISAGRAVVPLPKKLSLVGRAALFGLADLPARIDERLRPQSAPSQFGSPVRFPEDVLPL